MRGEHVQDIAQMRTTFERQLRRQRVDEEAKVEEIRRQADQVNAFSFYTQRHSHESMGCLGSRSISLRSHVEYTR
jgi:hypothetical protein